MNTQPSSSHLRLLDGGRPATPKVAGLVKMSTTDWPGKLAAVIFLQGCPWRCVYCHNDAILDPKAPAAMPWEEVLDFLGRRRGLLDGVVFSGGEPLIDAALPDAIRSVRKMGFQIGLHTGGAWPKRLAALLGVNPVVERSGFAPLARTQSAREQQASSLFHSPQSSVQNHHEGQLVDWVGLDIKHLEEKYAEVTGVKLSGKAAYQSLDVIVQSGIAHEVRTTIDPTVHSHDDVLELISQLRDYRSANGNIVQKHVLQEARAVGAAANHADAFTTWRLRHLIAEHEATDITRRAA